MTGTPLAYLGASGIRAERIVALTWFTLIVSVIVCVVVGVLLWRGSRRGGGGDAAATRAIPVARGGNGLRWIAIGLILSAVPLLVTLVWTMAALAAIVAPPAPPAVTIDVIAHQWWWEFRYAATTTGAAFTTANEAHVPIGRPVLLRLHAGDVIHSFWVPRLSGKTDVIPGQINQSWLQADEAGRYRGQCAEYCGLQHARMAFAVVAERPTAFAGWQAAQRRDAMRPASAAAARGLALVEARCGLCHQVRGTAAAAVVGPDLTHLASRRTIAAGTLPNDPAHLAGWIADPQAAKPGAAMPPTRLAPAERADLLAYLATLR